MTEVSIELSISIAQAKFYNVSRIVDATMATHA